MQKLNFWHERITRHRNKILRSREHVTRNWCIFQRKKNFQLSNLKWFLKYTRNLFLRLWDLSTIGVHIPELFCTLVLFLFGNSGVLVFELFNRCNPTRIESFFFVMFLFMSSSFKRKILKWKKRFRFSLANFLFFFSFAQKFIWNELKVNGHIVKKLKVVKNENKY